MQPGYQQHKNDEPHPMQESGAGSAGDTSAITSRYAIVPDRKAEEYVITWKISIETYVRMCYTIIVQAGKIWTIRPAQLFYFKRRVR